MALIILGLAATGGAIAGAAINFMRLPIDVRTLQNYMPSEATRIFDSKNRLLANMHDEENRAVVPLKVIPKYAQLAVIAIEDRRFYQHRGVDPVGIARAIKADLQGRDMQGGSTITQQLARNLFLTTSRTISRKLAEAWVAIQIEHYYPKHKILELYLNQVYWGHNAYGIESAAQNYFGKPARKLSLAESALLAGLISGPEIYSPYRNPKLAKERQEMVLNVMLEEKFITAKEYKWASQAKLVYPGIRSYTMQIPYFTSQVEQYLMDKYGPSQVLKGGLRVVTTVDMDLQLQAEKIIAEGVKHLSGYNVHEGALVCLDPHTGFVKALVGGTDFHKSQFNRATQALRQPGSSFKPFIYLTAFMKGISPESVEEDAPIEYQMEGGQVWRPRNYDFRYRGTITLRRAIINSVNIIAVKTLDKVGIKEVIETAHKAGIKSQLGEYLSLALGSAEVTPMEMASAYGTFAAGGLHTEPTFVMKITDRFGHVIEDNTIPHAKRVLDEDPILVLSDVLQDVVNYGTGTGAQLGNRPVAGKTGTTSDWRDAWFVGYTPQLATAVWVGNDNNKPLYHMTGGDGCAPLWAKFMRIATKDLPIVRFKTPKHYTGEGSSSVSDGHWHSTYHHRDRGERPTEPPYKGVDLAVPERRQPAHPAAIPNNDTGPDNDVIVVPREAEPAGHLAPPPREAAPAPVIEAPPATNPIPERAEPAPAGEGTP